jgi:hypothetical protein
MGGKSSGGGGTQQVEQTTSNLPEYARPYFEELLGERYTSLRDLMNISRAAYS